MLTEKPSGHSQNYCKGYRAGAGSSASNNNATSPSFQADVAHCHQKEWPSYYSVGFQDGKDHPGTPCPSGHSASFCSGWNAGAGNTTHCGTAGYPSCYSLGYADGLQHLGASCPSGHTPNYCAGWNAAAGNTTHCDQPGWPSCYGAGYLAGKNAPGTTCPPGHSNAFCNGYATGAGTTPLVDTHCDTSAYPSCYSLGYQAGKNTALGTPCPSGHSLNYCSGWEVGNRSKAPPSGKLTVQDASYKTTLNTPVKITLTAQDEDRIAKVTISLVSKPAHGSLKTNGASNEYIYTPDTGFLGADGFQYQASDNNGSKSNVGTISITVGSSPPPTGVSLRILSHTSYISSIGTFHVVGEVENDGNATAKFVKVIVTFYDSNHTVVGTSFTFTEPPDLASGDKAPFDLMLLSASVPMSEIRSYNLHLAWQ
jgi:Bacterial Ig domain